MENRALKIKLRGALQSLRKQYAHAVRAQEVSSVTEWLGDNYYLLAREGASALKDIRHITGLPADKNGIPQLFSFCLQLCENGVLPNTQELASRLRKRSLCAAEVQNLELMLRCALVYTAHTACREGAQQDAKILGNAIQSLRNLQEVDFPYVIENTSKLEQLLLADPAGIYTQMDEGTRAEYRRLVQQRAKKEQKDELEILHTVLKQAQRGNTPRERHIGTYL